MLAEICLLFVGVKRIPVLQWGRERMLAEIVESPHIGVLKA